MVGCKEIRAMIWKNLRNPRLDERLPQILLQAGPGRNRAGSEDGGRADAVARP